MGEGGGGSAKKIHKIIFLEFSNLSNFFQYFFYYFKLFFFFLSHVFPTFVFNPKLTWLTHLLSFASLFDIFPLATPCIIQIERANLAVKKELQI